MDKEKIKVLMIGPDRSVHGGISGLVNGYYHVGLDKKVDLRYIGTMKEGSKLKKLMVAGLSYVRFCMCVGKYDIVHVNVASDNSFWRKALFIKCAKRRNKKIVIHQHGGNIDEYYESLDEKRKEQVRNIFGMADVLLVLTNGLNDFFGTIVDRRKILILPNGVVTQGVGVDKDKKDYTKILFLGRICRNKGISELLEAMDEIHAKNPEAMLYLGGIYEDNEYRSEVEKRASYVSSLGWITGKAKDDWLDKCGIFVLPSYFEGFPLSVIEGMLHGCAVVSTDVGGVPEAIEDGESGILIKPKDVEGLKNAIERIICDKNFAKKISNGGIKTAKEKYSLEKNTEKLIEIYRKVLNY
ncbi:MAG: glycosyltransferase family 4 protein [Butyrivibrio sp.]|nr:glycosyltransferase family 4 protein [Butyrivibrio sp.]